MSMVMSVSARMLQKPLPQTELIFVRTQTALELHRILKIMKKLKLMREVLIKVRVSVFMRMIVTRMQSWSHLFWRPSQQQRCLGLIIIIILVVLMVQEHHPRVMLLPMETRSLRLQFPPAARMRGRSQSGLFTLATYHMQHLAVQDKLMRMLEQVILRCSCQNFQRRR